MLEVSGLATSRDLELTEVLTSREQHGDGDPGGGIDGSAGMERWYSMGSKGRQALPWV